jgi:multidrug efflux pump subunit AcrB
MAIGAPGEEQNAVLARAVIGGVMIGTLTTLLFVPWLYSIIGRFEPTDNSRETEGEAAR